MDIVEFTPPIEIHDTLNPKLWEGQHLRKDVRVALLRIAKEYYKFLEIDVPVIDLLITGSQANFNYSKFSDLDLHIVVPFSQIECDVAVQELFDTKRRLWKENHNIHIHGVPVELYAEDVAKPAVSSSYSVIKGIWIKRPDRVDVNYEEDEVKRLVAAWERVIELAVKSNNLEVCTNIKDLLKVFRQASLDKDGEFGSGNLTFKSLRNDGMISKLMEKIIELTDKQLSI